MRVNIRYILKMLGAILIFETFFMLAATIVAYFYGEGDFVPFLISLGIMSVAGTSFYLTGRKANEYQAGRREGILTVSLTWLVLSLFGMMPYFIGGYIPDFTNAYFETMSGYTTTGFTILNDIESLPHGILFWRTLTQWQGGIGVVVFSVALLPMSGGSASQLFDAETTGFSHTRFRPRITQVAKLLSGVYLLLTLVFFLLLWAGPMDAFEAVNHAMGGICTGGYSTKDASLAYWNSPYIDYVMIVCMCVGGINLTLLYLCIFRGQIKKLYRDEETHWYILSMALFAIITVGWLFYNGFETGSTDVENTIRKGVFQVVALMTTTGYMTAEYANWGELFWLIVIMISIVCGCGGSTSGGLKMGRAMVLVKNLFNEFRRQTHPAAVLPVRVNGRVVSQETIYRVHIFATVYFILIFVSWAVLILEGFNFEEAIGTAVSAISNVGPSLGKYSYGNVHDVSVGCKWYLSFIMMTGRLEVFTVLTILLPGFWKR